MILLQVVDPKLKKQEYMSMAASLNFSQKSDYFTRASLFCNSFFLTVLKKCFRCDEWNDFEVIQKAYEVTSGIHHQTEHTCL